MSVFIRKDRDVWAYEFKEGGRRYKRNCIMPDGTPATSRRQAQACEDAARVAARLESKGAIVRPSTYTLAQAVAVRGAEAEGFASWVGIRAALRDLVEFFGEAAAIGDVAAKAASYRAHVDRFTRQFWIGGPGDRRDRADPRNWRDTGLPLSAERKNKYLDELRAVLSIAHKTRSAGGVPMLAAVPEIREFQIPKRDPTPVPLAVLARIETDPATPDHLWKAAALVRLLGLRRFEVFAATADWIDFENGGLRVPAAVTKSNRDDFLPANDEARELLAWLAFDVAERARGPMRAGGTRDDARHLIVYRPAGSDDDGREHAARPIKNARRAWRGALVRAGVKRFRFHDIRATFVTELAHVAPSAVTQDLARHKDAATTKRYVKIADRARQAAVDAMRGTADVLPTGTAGEAFRFGGQSPTQGSHPPRLRRIK
jgi:integrase